MIPVVAIEHDIHTVHGNVLCHLAGHTGCQRLGSTVMTTAKSGPSPCYVLLGSQPGYFTGALPVGKERHALLHRIMMIRQDSPCPFKVGVPNSLHYFPAGKVLTSIQYANCICSCRVPPFTLARSSI